MTRVRVQLSRLFRKAERRLMLNTHVLESEVEFLGQVPVRLTWWNGRLVGVEYWRVGAHGQIETTVIKGDRRS